MSESELIDTPIVAPPRNPLAHGWDYGKRMPLCMRRTEWREKFAAVTKAGGTRRLVGNHGSVKDPTAFDAKGRMLFEVYDASC